VIDGATDTVSGLYYEDEQLVARWAGVLRAGAEAPCEVGLGPNAIIVSVAGCPASPVEYGANVTLTASTQGFAAPLKTWFQWNGATPIFQGSSTASVVASSTTVVQVTAFVYRDSNVDARWNPGEELGSSTESCPIVVLPPDIDGRWAISSYRDGALYGMCLTIELESLQAVFDGCDGPNVLVSARPLIITATTVILEFFVSLPLGAIVHVTLAGDALNADFYSVDLTMEGPGGYTFHDADAQMERLGG
jgi:hypothetical protein